MFENRQRVSRSAQDHPKVSPITSGHHLSDHGSVMMASNVGYFSSLNSVLETAPAQPKVYRQRRKCWIMYVSISERAIRNKQKDREHQARKAPRNQPNYRGALPAEVPCAGITHRVQAYSACSTSPEHQKHGRNTTPSQTQIPYQPQSDL